MGFFAFLTRSTLKVGAVAAAVKISLDNDVWTLQTDAGENAYERFKRNIVNGTIVYKEKMPPPDELKTEVGSCWNNTVNCTFDCLNNAPEKVKQKINSLYKSNGAAPA